METLPLFGTVENAAQFWSVVFGIWVLSAVVNVAIADIRKRNMIVWGLIGLVFGPVSILVMWMIVRPKKVKKEEKEEPSDGDATQSS